MKERIIRFNLGTNREIFYFSTDREKWPKTGAFVRHVHTSV